MPNAPERKVFEFPEFPVNANEIFKQLKSPLKIVAIAGHINDVGKTSLAIALARRLRELKCRVLVVSTELFFLAKDDQKFAPKIDIRKELPRDIDRRNYSLIILDEDYELSFKKVVSMADLVIVPTMMAEDSMAKCTYAVSLIIEKFEKPCGVWINPKQHSKKHPGKKEPHPVEILIGSKGVLALARTLLTAMG